VTTTLIATRPALSANLALALVVPASPVQGPWWTAVALGIARDLTLCTSFGHGFVRGRIQTRAVSLYNAVDRFSCPVVLGAAVVALLHSPGAPLAWPPHIAIDRAVGYGLRAPHGFKRP
jgi:hypothetical protein